jgi:hypothetical protein
MVALSDYAGREQSYVKHIFLERYLEWLVHKVASSYAHIVYVDGFAAPWQSANERLEDTSFIIALTALCRAKASWKEHGRDVEMSAFLVERDAEACAKLAQVPVRYPDLTIETYPADFLKVLPDILKEPALKCLVIARLKRSKNSQKRAPRLKSSTPWQRPDRARYLNPCMIWGRTIWRF